MGASIVGAGAVRNYSDMPTNIGEMRGGMSERVKRIADALTNAGLQTAGSDDIWKKHMANIAVSATCAVANLTIKQMMSVPELRETAFAALNEAAAVARAEGIDLDVTEAQDVLPKISGEGGTGDNKPSLCLDILNKRPSEIDFINGAVARLGKRHGIPTPVNQTLGAAVKGWKVTTCKSHAGFADTTWPMARSK